MFDSPPLWIQKCSIVHLCGFKNVQWATFVDSKSTLNSRKVFLPMNAPSPKVCCQKFDQSFPQTPTQFRLNSRNWSPSSHVQATKGEILPHHQFRIVESNMFWTLDKNLSWNFIFHILARAVFEYMMFSHMAMFWQNWTINRDPSLFDTLAPTCTMSRIIKPFLVNICATWGKWRVCVKWGKRLLKEADMMPFIVCSCSIHLQMGGKIANLSRSQYSGED